MENSGLAEMAPPFTEVMEEGDIPNAEEMVKNLQVEAKCLEHPDKLPHLMRFRYQLLLEKTNPKELIESQPPSLSWLEDKYGHLVEKEFCYNHVVKLASTYLETCDGDVFDKTLGDLEKARGHLVPYTIVEKEYLQLMENYKKSRLQIDGRPSLEFLRKHHSKPPQDKAHGDITKSALEDVQTAPTFP